MPTDRASIAIVLVSGGLDSATVLAMAIDRGYDCHALTFRYGQKHAIEIEVPDSRHHVRARRGYVATR